MFAVLRCLPSNRLVCRMSIAAPTTDMAKYKEMFSRRMAMAGIEPHHRIALGVSGGPDSVGLCILASDWKRDALAAKDATSGYIDGLLGIIVDHRLRPESSEEAEHARDIILKLGIRCEMAHCNWSSGRPKQGHLLEAARDLRYQIFQEICIREGIGVLLIAHHANDQEELFILRLSRNSGVLGLAGMAFICQLFPSNHYGGIYSSYGVLLVRPLLDFVKDDLYKVCQNHGVDWVEDPENQNLSFARNRIRMSFRNMSSEILRSELQVIISACRRTRAYVDKACRNLIDKAVVVLHGYAVIDLKSLDSSNVEDLCLMRFITVVIQFVSQRHRPVRARVSQMLLDYFRSFPCKSSLTAAGCYLCAAPGSKGRKILVCYSVPSAMKLSSSYYIDCQQQSPLHVAEEIVLKAKLLSEYVAPWICDAPFLHVTNSKHFLSEAKKLGLLSEHTCQSINLLKNAEASHFCNGGASNVEEHLGLFDNLSSSSFDKTALLCGQLGHFMNRFLVSWELCCEVVEDGLCVEMSECMGETCRVDFCRSCPVGQELVVVVRHMLEDDWKYLSRLVKDSSSNKPAIPPEGEFGRDAARSCSEYLCISAQRALQVLKSIPAAGRRGLPVLVNPQGLLLSIPNIYFKHCPHLSAKASFKPRVPMGGGYSSYL